MVGARLTLRLYRVMGGRRGGAVGRPTTIEGSMGQCRAMGGAIGHPTTIEGSIGQCRALWGSYGVDYGAL